MTHYRLVDKLNKRIRAIKQAVSELAPLQHPLWQVEKWQTERSHDMGDKGGKKDKNKSEKQKKSKQHQKEVKKQDKQQKNTP